MSIATAMLLCLISLNYMSANVIVTRMVTATAIATKPIVVIKTVEHLVEKHNGNSVMTKNLTKIFAKNVTKTATIGKLDHKAIQVTKMPAQVVKTVYKTAVHKVTQMKTKTVTV